MSRTLAALTLLAALAAVAPQAVSGQLAPARRGFLFKGINRQIFLLELD